MFLDTGPDNSSDAARHLRLTLRRMKLVSNSHGGGDAVRYAACKLYDLAQG
ncbi:hypothetical protein [Streptomyces sp. NPDC002671]